MNWIGNLAHWEMKFSLNPVAADRVWEFILFVKVEKYLKYEAQDCQIKLLQKWSQTTIINLEYVFKTDPK